MDINLPGTLVHGIQFYGNEPIKDTLASLLKNGIVAKQFFAKYNIKRECGFNAVPNFVSFSMVRNDSNYLETAAAGQFGAFEDYGKGKLSIAINPGFISQNNTAFSAVGSSFFKAFMKEYYFDENGRVLGGIILGEENEECYPDEVNCFERLPPEAIGGIIANERIIEVREILLALKSNLPIFDIHGKEHIFQ